MPIPRAPELPRRSSFPLRAAIVLLTLSLFGCDHATKLVAAASLSHDGRAVSVVRGVLDLRYTVNPDTAFSLFRNLGIAPTPSILVAASAIAILGILAAWIASRKRATRLQHVGFALVLAGALGNVVDRAVRGYVVDFIHLTYWPVFNVADVAVVAGMLLLMLAALRTRNDPQETPAPITPDAPS